MSLLGHAGARNRYLCCSANLGKVWLASLAVAAGQGKRMRRPRLRLPRRSESWAMRASPDACRQLSAPHCLGGRRGERESEKIGIEGEGIHLKASPLVCKVLKDRPRAAGRNSGELSSSK